MKFSYNWLQSYFKKALPEPDELADALTMHSFEVEGVEKKNGDYLLEIDILPNRAHDCLSHYGLARECAALFVLEMASLPALGNEPKDGQDKEVLSVKILNTDLCRRYSAYVIEGIKITESRDLVKGRLESVGQKPINNVVDVTNYIVWELGQPLHAFDFEKIKGSEMTVRLSKAGEKVETLDGEIRELDDRTLIIEDSERLIDLAGIKGGANTQIDKDTKTIVLQAAIFDAAHIRRSSQYLGLRTDAAMRYMHGFDPNLPVKALRRGVELLMETNPDAKIVQKIDIYSDPAKPKRVSLSYGYINGLLGVNIPEDEVRVILKRLGCTVSALRESDKKAGGFAGELSVEVPDYRLDLNIREDLVEEIGRIYGYENINGDPPRGILITPYRNDRVLWRRMARGILRDAGFSEVYNYSLISRDEISGFGFEIRELANPVSDEFRFLRPSLIPGILKNMARNSRYGETAQIFETGKVFCGNEEKENIIIALNDFESIGFYRLKGYLDDVLKKFGITDFYFDPAFSSEDEKRHGFLLHPGRRANIFIDSKFAGFMGEVSPALCSEYSLKNRVFCAEIDFGEIADEAEDEHIYQKPSKYPDVVRDVAILAPRDVRVVDVMNLINSSGGELLRDVDLFDMYEGENLPDGMKNLAFHLIFQSEDRTLTSEEVDSIMNGINENINEKGWEVR